MRHGRDERRGRQTWRLKHEAQIMLPQPDLPDKETPRLLVDAMLGRLAHWLRLLGYDTLYWREGSDLALAEQAAAEDRLIVTRDRQLAARRGVRTLLVTAEDLDAQLVEVRAALGGRPEPFSRCPECNAMLEDLSRAAARDLVPTYVWHTQTTFRRCPGCGRVFWKGTHWPGLSARLEGNPD
jgi:uncharacterized protein with PIN domain